MSERITLRRSVVVALSLAVTAVPSTAYAGGGKNGNGSQRGSVAAGSGDGKISVETKVVPKPTGGSSKDDSGTNGTLTSSDSNWTPPACWYEPAFSPKELEATVKDLRTPSGIPLIGGLIDGVKGFVADVYDLRYKNGEYKNYNLDQEGKGMFWAGVVNPNRKDDPAANSCTDMPFWVPSGTTPSNPKALNPKTLAEYAYDELELPPSNVTMAPSGTSTVNLPTWVWSTDARFTKKSVTASLPGSGLSATTTAEPVSVRIDPGTTDAQLYPDAGGCTIHQGQVGEPFASGKAGQDPPCGVKYLRPGSYTLKATVTWKITWSSTDGQGGALPDGIYTGKPQPVTVQEIQSINR
ncbi:hypothetical protein ACGFW5_32290 [Streptomyces sp. NPDC048416]|uniref:hypothetical protein n=1 Tax=Streptomyces sp. NPDC048416 TaxID=3365546 RepID=UPI003713EEC6